jgi:hypothetical protein
MLAPSELRSQRGASTVKTTDDESRLIDDERKLEPKICCKRQTAQCEGSLDSGARSEWFAP